MISVYLLFPIIPTSPAHTPSHHPLPAKTQSLTYKLINLQYYRLYRMLPQTQTQGQNQTQSQPRGKEVQFSIFSGQQDMMVRSVSKELDQFFQGGLHKGTITQLYGEAGCGKSQIAMLFTLGLMSRNVNVCFLSTEKELSWQRFTTLAYNFMNEDQYQQNQKYLLYKRSSDYSQGYAFIEESMQKIKDRGRGGLLVVDSVHTFVMSCLQHHNIQNDVFQKSKKQAEIVNRIRWLAKMAGAAVLFINHAADVIDKRRGSSGRTVVPTLGHAWELNLDQNIYLTRKGDIRELSVVHSPKCPKNRKKRFRFDSSGLTWISEDGVQYIE